MGTQGEKPVNVINLKDKKMPSDLTNLKQLQYDSIPTHQLKRKSRRQNRLVLFIKMLPRLGKNASLFIGLSLLVTTTQAASTGILNKISILTNLTPALGSLNNFPNGTYPGDGAYKSYDGGFKSWLTNNAPFLETPQPEFDQVYYYRWWLYNQHIKHTGNFTFPYILTEFYPDVSWAGLWNSINCAAGHHIHEGRWLKDTRYMNSYERFWLLTNSSPHSYSFWIADSYYNKFLVDGNTNILIGLLPGLTNVYAWWENPANGKYDTNRNLYMQIPDRDGMETDIDSYEEGGAACYRATINSYLYGDSVAISRIAALAGNAALAGVYSNNAASLKASFQSQMWDAHTNFFWDRRGDNFKEFSDFELMGYTPWYFNMPDAQYSAAWQYLVGTNNFNGAYGLRTARYTYSSYKSYYGGSGGVDYWNGFTWPYETSVVLTGMANLLNNYTQTYVTKADYFNQLYKYAISMHQTAQNTNTGLSILEFEDPDTGVWNPTGNNARAYDYNHSSFNDLVINGLVGVRPRPDNILQVNPLVPTNWDYFCLEDIPYHGRMLTVLFDRYGTRYSKGTGFQVYVEGQLVYSNANVGPMTCDFGSIPPSFDPTVDENNGGLSNAALNTSQAGYPSVSASYTDSISSVWQAVDGVVSYNNYTINRWTCIGSTNSSDWLAVDFGQTLTVNAAKIYFYADGISNSSPGSYSLNCWDGSAWQVVTNLMTVPPQPEGNAANYATFNPVNTQKIRVLVNHQSGFHSAISEIQVFAVPFNALPAPPYFIVNPVGQVGYISNAITLTAIATNSQPISYQWHCISTDGLRTNAVAGATNTSLTITNPTFGSSGYYYLNATNVVGSTNSLIAQVQIVPIPGLITVNGDFELPAFGANSMAQSVNGVGVADWLSPINSYEAWQIGSGRVMSGSQDCEFAPDGGGWIYQSLGAYNASLGTNLFWTLTQETGSDGQNSGNIAISFYAQTGAFAPAQGADIEGATGVTPIGADPTASFPSLNSLMLVGLTNNGSLNLSGLANGTIIWVRVANTGKNGSGNGYAGVDNVFVTQTPVQLSVGRLLNGQFQLMCNYNYGTLLLATNLNGPWTAAAGANSLFTVAPSSGTPQMFYKVSIP